MRRAFALAALISLVAAGTAAAEHWTKYADGDAGTQWSYDSDFTYKDKDSGLLIAMKAISKPSANFEPGGPDKGVGYVVAVVMGIFNISVLYRLLTGTLSEDELVQVVESEDVVHVAPAPLAQGEKA